MCSRRRNIREPRGTANSADNRFPSSRIASFPPFRPLHVSVGFSVGHGNCMGMTENLYTLYVYVFTGYICVSVTYDIFMHECISINREKINEPLLKEEISYTRENTARK